MIETPSDGVVDRRKFINGAWTKLDASRARNATEIASVLVQVRPERLTAVARKIEKINGAQIFSRDSKGKLVVVIEASDTGTIGGTLITISLLPDVLTAALVFQGTAED